MGGDKLLCNRIYLRVTLICKQSLFQEAIYNIYIVTTSYPITVSGCNVLSGVNISDEQPATTAPPTEPIKSNQLEDISPTHCKPGAS